MFRLFAAVLFCGTFLSAGSTVRADEPAAVQHDRLCVPMGAGMTYCTTMKLVQHTAAQPGGGQSFVYHYELTEEMTGPTGALSSSTISDDIHFVTMEGLMHELHLRSHFSASVPGFTCEFETFYHYANGEVQIDRTEYSC
jgi:hypothetical protein